MESIQKNTNFFSIKKQFSPCLASPWRAHVPRHFIAVSAYYGFTTKAGSLFRISDEIMGRYNMGNAKQFYETSMTLFWTCFRSFYVFSPLFRFSVYLHQVSFPQHMSTFSLHIVHFSYGTFF